jgi:hypothetical protein
LTRRGIVRRRRAAELARAPPRESLTEVQLRGFTILLLDNLMLRVKARRARMEAASAGKKWYFTGEPCNYGHIKDRLVTNGKCRECKRQDSERYNRLYR